MHKTKTTIQKDRSLDKDDIEILETNHLTDEEQLIADRYEDDFDYESDDLDAPENL